MRFAYAVCFLFWAVLVDGQSILSQEDIPLHVHKAGTQQPFTADALIADPALYGIEAHAQLHLQRSSTDRQGINHHRYQQYHEGLPVVGGVLTFHESGHRLIASTGVYMEGIQTGHTVNVSRESAENTAEQHLISHVKEALPQLVRTMTKPTAKVVRKVVIGTAYPHRSTDYVKAYHIQVDAHSQIQPLSRDVYVDMASGTVVASLNRVAHEHVPATGTGVFYPDATFLVDSVAPNRYLMQDGTRGGGIVVRNIGTGETVESADNTWIFDTDGEASAVDVFYATGKYYDFMLEKFGRRSIDDEDFPLEADINFVGLVNAFWNGQQAFFGAGDCDEYLPLTNMEIVSHEYTHGFTQFTSGLIYQGQSGGLNEGMSDIFGKALEYYEDSERFNWYIGKTIARDPQLTNPFRSMEDPTERFSPKYYKGEFWSDLAGVHRLSGVLNHWFYLLVEGGMGTNEGGYDYDVAPMGMDDAIQLVYHLQTNFLVPTSTYPDAFELSKLSCEMLYGASSPQMESMLEAWATVGLSDAILYNDLSFSLELPQVREAPDLTCADVLEDFTVVLRYEGATPVPAPFSVSGEVVIYDLGNDELLHTIPLDNQILEQELSFGDSIVLYIQSPEPVETWVVRVEARVFVTDATGANSVVLDRTFRIADGRIPSANVTLQYADECDKSEGVSQAYIFVGKPSCRLADEVPLRVDLVGPSGTVSTDEIAVFSDGSSGTFVFGLENSLGLSDLDNLQDHELQVYAITPEGVELLRVVDLGSDVKARLADNTTIRFDDNQWSEVLTTDESIFASVEVTNEELLIRSFEDGQALQDCLPLDQYYESLGSNNLYRSTIGFCAQPLMEDAVLKMKVRFMNTDETVREYQHGIQVSQGGIPIFPMYLSSTGTAGEEIAVPLLAGAGEQITIEVVTVEGGSVALDDIGVEYVVSTDDVSDADTRVQHQQLVRDELQLWAHESMSGAKVALYTVAGQLAGQYTWDSTSDMSIQMADKQSGMYVLTVRDAAGYIYTGKVIKID